MSTPQILIVQDNPADIDLLRMALDQLQEPYEIVALKDGAEALRFVRGRYSGIGEPEPCDSLESLSSKVRWDGGSAGTQERAQS